MLTRFMRFACPMILLSYCWGQPAGSPKTIAIGATAAAFTRYPSLEPVTKIDVSMDTTQPVQSAVEAQIRAGWDCTKISSYKVSIVATTGGTTKVVRDAPIESLNAAATHCKPPDDIDVGSVTLFLRSAISDQEMFQVTLENLPDKAVTIQSMPVTGPKAGSNVAFTATPQSAPGESLTNKKTRDVGQLAVSFSDTDLIRNLPVDLYAKSTDLFSTDERDAKSAFSGVVGISHGVFNKLYSPGHIEGGFQGNQVATNLSAVVNAGVTTLLPWGSALMNGVIQVPLPPDITLNGQYANRIRQDPVTTKKPLATNDFTVNPSIAWTSISLPWTCSFFKWLNGDKATPGLPSEQYKYCAGVELDLGLWYLPLDLTSKGSQRVEGYGDISFLVPLSSLSFAKGILPHVTSGDYTKSRVRIKYGDTVNVANNFVRSKTWTYGIELIK